MEGINEHKEKLRQKEISVIEKYILQELWNSD